MLLTQRVETLCYPAGMASGADAIEDSRCKRFLTTRNVILVLATFALGAIAYYPVRYLDTLGDVSIYRDYANAVLANPAAFPKEYPPPSILLFLLPRILGAARYFDTFNALAALALAATVVIVDRLTRRGFWLLTLFALGTWAVIFTRYDIFVVWLTVLAFAAARRQRWVLAQGLLAGAAALKLYPLFLMPLVVLWQWRSARRLPLAALTSGAIFLFVVAGASWFAAAPALHQMWEYHAQRPFEFESLGATLLWLTRPVTIAVSYGCFGIEPSPPFILGLASVLTVLLPITVYFAFARGYLRPAPAWALVLLFLLAAAKVFSPQYLIWVLPFIVLAESPTQPGSHVFRYGHRAIWLCICILTSVVYPFALERIFGLRGSESDRDSVMLLVTLRNLLWLLACLVAALHWTSQKNLTSNPESSTPVAEAPVE